MPSSNFVSMVQVEKQPPDVFCKNRYSEKIRKFHRKTPVLESLFNKVAGLRVCNFIKTRLQHSFFPVKFSNFLRTPTLKNIWERLLLQMPNCKKVINPFLANVSCLIPPENTRKPEVFCCLQRV